MRVGLQGYKSLLRNAKSLQSGVQRLENEAPSPSPLRLCRSPLCVLDWHASQMLCSTMDVVQPIPCPLHGMQPTRERMSFKQELGGFLATPSSLCFSAFKKKKTGWFP